MDHCVKWYEGLRVKMLELRSSLKMGTLSCKMVRRITRICFFLLLCYSTFMDSLRKKLSALVSYLLSLYGDASR